MNPKFRPSEIHSELQVYKSKFHNTDNHEEAFKGTKELKCQNALFVLQSFPCPACIEIQDWANLCKSSQHCTYPK